MGMYIPKSVVLAEIEKRRDLHYKYYMKNGAGSIAECKYDEDRDILSLLDTLEVKEVDLKKLGEIARHLIAVKEHIEDMRLDKEEWLMLEKIGYTERFKAQKGEEV
jgi:Zn-finger domain-containing protein